MPTVISLAIHMWFADGEGWAFHPDVKRHLPIFLKAVDRFLKSGKDKQRFVVSLNGATLIGAKFPDEACRDPKAANRSPYVLLLGYLEGPRTNAPTIDQIHQQLSRVRLPDGPGESESMVVDLTPEIRSATKLATPGYCNDGALPLNRAAEKPQVEQNIGTERMDALSAEIDELIIANQQLSNDAETLRSAREAAIRKLAAAKRQMLTIAVIGLFTCIIRGMVVGPRFYEIASVAGLAFAASLASCQIGFRRWYNPRRPAGPDAT